MADTLCKHGSASCGWCHDKSGALFHEAAQTTMADTSELLTFCDEAEEKCRVGRQDGHWPEIAPHKIEAIVRYAKSRLQAEAPLDTKVAGSWCKKCGHYFPDPSHEAGCQSRTSQAEAQAPAVTPTREQIARVLAKAGGCDLGYSQEFVRCIREIPSCGCAKQAAEILALLPTTAPAPVDATITDLQAQNTRLREVLEDALLEHMDDGEGLDHWSRRARAALTESKP